MVSLPGAGSARLRVVRSVRTGLWFVPVACTLLGVGLSFATIAVDRAFDHELIPRTLTGGPDAALEVLATVATSMVSLTALVLTITMVVVQLAMGQFSPRIVQTILRDKPSQAAIGIFVATFAHAMLALREVDTEDGGTVPGLAVLVAYLLILVSVVVLVLYVHHIGRALRVSALIELVGDDIRKVLDRTYPSPAPTGAAHPAQGRVVADHSGVLNHIDHDELVDVAARAGCVLHLVPAFGDFVPADAPLFEVEGDAATLDHRRARRAVVLGMERTLEQDVGYGFRMLVDIAERSLSDSPFEDPTTAVQAIDRLHDCLRQLAARPFPSGRHADASGAVRLVVPSMQWDDYVRLAFEEIRLAGARSPQITRRLIAALRDLQTVAPPDRQAPLERQLELLRSGPDRSDDDAVDGQTMLAADAQGLGVGPR
jgi:uncharacterized membrane protein